MIRNTSRIFRSCTLPPTSPASSAIEGTTLGRHAGGAMVYGRPAKHPGPSTSINNHGPTYLRPQSSYGTKACWSHRQSRPQRSVGLLVWERSPNWKMFMFKLIGKLRRQQLWKELAWVSSQVLGNFAEQLLSIPNSVTVTAPLQHSQLQESLARTFTTWDHWVTWLLSTQEVLQGKKGRL